MTKKEMLEAVSKKANVNKVETEKVFNSTFELLIEEIEKGGVRVDGFGTFKVTSRAARTAKNPRTGEEVKVPAKKVVTFKAAAVLKDGVK